MSSIRSDQAIQGSVERSGSYTKPLEGPEYAKSRVSDYVQETDRPTIVTFPQTPPTELTLLLPRDYSKLFDPVDKLLNQEAGTLAQSRTSVGRNDIASNVKLAGTHLDVSFPRLDSHECSISARLNPEAINRQLLAAERSCIGYLFMSKAKIMPQAGRK
ncbi:hypothetical protein K449DRAFT_402293 [Hypoxylon sp. EC38]|nr:hypothetical protein K449DRAFT_402293 [Hypoxylon sp. EC38]